MKKFFVFFAILAFLPIPVSAITFNNANINNDDESSYGVAAADINKDGDIDIYVANYGSQNNLWINDGEANFVENNISGDLGSSTDAAIADFNNDNHLDIYVSNIGQNNLWINDGNNNFILQNILDDDELSYGVSIGDIDNDGDIDIHVSNTGQNNLWINDGEANFVENNISGDGQFSKDSEFADFDNDGDLDLYVANENDRSNYLWINDGSGNFSLETLDGDLGDSHGVGVGDYDNDGDPDIYVSNKRQPNKLWNNDSGLFTSYTNNLTTQSYYSEDAIMADLNFDGYIDIYEITNYASGSPQNILWLGNGENFFESNIDGDTGKSSDAIFEDFNGDNVLDLYTANTTGQNKLYLNTTTSPDSDPPTVSTLTPADDATNVALDSDLVIEFNESVSVETGNLYVYDSDDNLVETINVTSESVTGDGTDTITINIADLNDSTSFYVQIDATAIDDLVGNSYAGISDSTTWNFATVDTTNPSVQTVTPVDDATEVLIDTDLMIEFSEAVNVESGNINIYDDEDTWVESIDVTGDSVTGDGTDTITVNIADLDYITNYSIQIDATAFNDTAGNSYAGIADSITWNFTTRAYPAGGAISPWKGSGNDFDDESNGNKVDEVKVDAEKIDQEVEVSERRKTIFRIILRILLEQFGL